MPTPNIQTPTSTLSTLSLSFSPPEQKQQRQPELWWRAVSVLARPLTLHQLFVSAAPQQHQQRTQRRCGRDSDLWVSQWKGLRAVHGLTFHVVNSLCSPHLCFNLRHYLSFNSRRDSLTMWGQFCGKRSSWKSKDSNLKTLCSALTCSFLLCRWMLERDHKDVSCEELRIKILWH